MASPRTRDAGREVDEQSVNSIRRAGTAGESLSTSLSRNVFLSLVIVCASFFAPAVFSQSQMPSGSNYLQVTDIPANGDRDGIVVAFFEIPVTVTDTLYFGVYDSAQGGAEDAGVTMATIFTLIGGAGALSGTDSRAVDFTVSDPYTDGTELDQFDSSVSGTAGSWVYFNAVSPRSLSDFALGLKAGKAAEEYP